jgi:hypothetical protein
MSTHSRIDGIRDILVSLQKLHKSLQEDYRKALAPITVFIDSMIPIHTRMTDILPKKHVCDRLLTAYIDTSETLYRMIHVPTFRKQYDLYWEGQPQPESFLPQLLTVLSIGSRFETKSKGLGHERVEGVHIPTACALVRSWLDGLRGKQLVELTTLQTEVLLLHARRMVTPRHQDSWTQLGAIVRMAMTMGLHRDPSEFEPRMSVFRGEMRRRFWFTILDMDLHMSLACNLPCLVREGDYSCQPPRNLDDVDLYPDMQELPPSRPLDQYTDNQIQVYAAMTLGVRMKVAHLVNRIDSVGDFQEILDVGNKLERFLEDINYLFPRHGVLSESDKSKQWRSRVILDMHVRRPLLSLYRPFALGVLEAPRQISRAYLRSSMVILKYLDELDPMVAHFQDITDMYHQVLKQDIIQAAFSVCFYIKSAMRSSSETTPYVYLGAGMSPAESIDENIPLSTDNMTLWSPARLTKTVEKTLDLLIHNVSGNDVKDIVSLAAVFYSVQNPALDDMMRGLHMTLENCMRSTNTSHEKLAAMPLPMKGMDLGAGGPPDPYAAQQPQPRPPFLFRGQAAPTAVSSFGDWVLWQGWDA